METTTPETEIESGRQATQEELRRVMSAMGRRRTEKKAATSAVNGRMGGRPRKALADILCTCGAADGELHKWNCPRGQAIAKREAREKAAATPEGPSRQQSAPVKRRTLADAARAIVGAGFGRPVDPSQASYLSELEGFPSREQMQQYNILRRAGTDETEAKRQIGLKQWP